MNNTTPPSPPSPPPLDFQHYDRLLPEQYNFKIISNVTANDVATAVVTVLDNGPVALAPDAAVALALTTPFVIAVIVALLCCCRGGSMWCCFDESLLYGCTGCCRSVSPLAGMTPHGGLEPDEEATDPDIVLDDDVIDIDPKLANNRSDSEEDDPPSQEKRPNGSNKPQRVANIDSDEDDEEEKQTSSNNSKASKQHCASVAAALDNDGRGSPVGPTSFSSRTNGKSGGGHGIAKPKRSSMAKPRVAKR